MGVVIGAHPGGRSKYAVSALFYGANLPALMFRSRAYSGTDEVLADIVGTYGEWGELAAVAIDAPLTWAGGQSGWRDCDLEIRERLPGWVPRTWIRPPNAISGAIGVQGPALAWSLAQEIRSGQLPKHRVVETNPRVGLARIAPDLRDAILTYREPKQSAKSRRAALDALLTRFTDAGLITLEDTPPASSSELDALICAIVALANAHPETGLIVQSFTGGDIRPVGQREVSLLYGIP